MSAEPTQHAAPLIRADGLSVRRDGRSLLDHVSLEVQPAEIVVLIGPNGAGKSTLLRALTGALRPSAGRVRRAPGLRIGYMPQKLAIDRSMPLEVDRFLALGGRADRSERAAALERVGIPGHARSQMTALSGGEMQRALLARALLRKPQLLLMDEPAQGLDHLGEAAFYAMAEELRREDGVAILLVSHDLHVVMRAADRVICLNGHVCCQGSPQTVSATPEYIRLFGPASDPVLAPYRHHHDHAH